MTPTVLTRDAEKPDSEDISALAGAAALGGLWLVVATLWTRGSGFLITIVLARLLAPDQFGLLGMANVALAAITMISELGLGAALVQRRRGPDFQAAASTAFWSNLAFGWLLVAMNALCAPLVAWYFHNPALTSILRVMGLQLGTNAFGAAQHALLSRELDYRRKLLPDSLPGLVNGIVAIWLALHGWGVWSLVVGAQLGAVAGVVTVWTVCPWRPRRLWDARLAASLFRFGKHVIGTELLRFVSQNVDYLVVGRLFGPAALGAYTLAFNLANVVLSNAGFLVARIAFPLFSRLQDDPARMRSAYLRLMEYLTLLSLPVLAGLCLLAGDFVSVAYGPRWESAIVPLRVMTALGLARALATVSAPVLSAMGRPDLLTRLGLLTAPLTAIGALAGAPLGLTGVAVGETIATLVTGALLMHTAFALIELEPRRLWERVTPMTRATVAMCGGVLLVGKGLTAIGVTAELRLGMSTAAGAAVYWLALGDRRQTLSLHARRLITNAATGSEGLGC